MKILVQYTCTRGSRTMRAASVPIDLAMVGRLSPGLSPETDLHKPSPNKLHKFEAELGYLRAEVNKLTLENQELRVELSDHGNTSHLEEMIASLTDNWHMALRRTAETEAKLAMAEQVLNYGHNKRSVDEAILRSRSPPPEPQPPQSAPPPRSRARQARASRVSNEIFDLAMVQNSHELTKGESIALAVHAARREVQGETFDAPGTPDFLHLMPHTMVRMKRSSVPNAASAAQSQLIVPMLQHSGRSIPSSLRRLAEETDGMQSPSVTPPETSAVSAKDDNGWRLNVQAVSAPTTRALRAQAASVRSVCQSATYDTAPSTPTSSDVSAKDDSGWRLNVQAVSAPTTRALKAQAASLNSTSKLYATYDTMPSTCTSISSSPSTPSVIYSAPARGTKVRGGIDDRWLAHL